ncbi:unnamed protein product [Clavelina lepadiformis]|uniref:RRM domain-containing protein n=1 Tax=Clavelina lepadiformis TaxID=159417 RepID=A0ABP0F460_CLALP
MGDSRKVFVGNIANDVTEDQLFSFFQDYGKVEEVAIIFDRDTGRSRGYGLVTFSSPNEAQFAIHAQNVGDLNGRVLTIRKAESRRVCGSGSGADGGGKYGDGGA